MSRNVSGQAYALTVLTPILDGHAAELTAHLDALPEGEASPLARVPGTHLGRWVVIDDVKYQGHGQRHRDRSPRARLLFTSNFDGDLDAYLERLQTGLGEDADASGATAAAIPAAATPGFARLAAARTSSRRRCSSPPTAARRWSRCSANLDKRARLIEFALEAQGLEPEELKARFLEAF